MKDPKLREEALRELCALYKEATERGDTAQAARLAEAIRMVEADDDAAATPQAVALATLPVQERELVEKLTEVDKLVAAQRWAEARALLETIDRSKLPVAVQPHVLNGLAFVIAQGGDVQGAMELVGNAMMDANARYKAAYERGDLAEAEHFSALMRALSGVNDSPESLEMEKVGKGERLILSERWAEARDVLASIDRSLLPEMNRPGILNNLAYATAQAGDPERAIELVGKGLKEAEALGDTYPPEKLPFFRGTHGIALTLAGRHEDAIALLAPLLEIEKPPRARSARTYYLGQSLRALGRTAEATRALEVAAAGEGPFVERAKTALAALRTEPQA